MDEMDIMESYSDAIEQLGATSLVRHYKEQKELEKTIEHAFKRIEDHYEKYGASLKEKLLNLLNEKIESLAENTELTILLVDIQNDFVLKGFSLYAPGGENTIYSNMALLDALEELTHKKPSVIQKVNLVTSQDAHLFHRTEESPDAKIMAQAYGAEWAKILREKEQHELQDFNPSQGQFGLHCICGTIGAAISMPIEDRLTKLQTLGIKLSRFGKITFSAPESGIKLKEDCKLERLQASIYEEPPLPFLKFFTSQSARPIQEILISGICADICVKQAAEGLSQAYAKEKTTVTVVDPCVHYLVSSPCEAPLSSYQKIKLSVLESFSKEPPVTYMTVDPYRSNPECRGEELEALEDLLKQLPHYFAKIDPDNHQKAYATRENLIHSLGIAQKKYHLNSLCANSIQREEALITFKQECKIAIEMALPDFQEDLPWMSMIKQLLTRFLEKILKIIGMGPATPRFFQRSSSPLEEYSPSFSEKVFL